MSTRAARDTRRQELRRSQRVSRQPVPQRRCLHQPRHGRALRLQLPVRIFRQQLRADAGGADPTSEHGRSGHHSLVSSRYS